MDILAIMSAATLVALSTLSDFCVHMYVIRESGKKPTRNALMLGSYLAGARIDNTSYNPSIDVPGETVVEYCLQDTVDVTLLHFMTTSFCPCQNLIAY